MPGHKTGNHQTLDRVLDSLMIFYLKSISCQGHEVGDRQTIDRALVPLTKLSRLFNDLFLSLAIDLWKN